METALFWCYLINSVLLITHEIESAYWKEWELFRLPGGFPSFSSSDHPGPRIWGEGLFSIIKKLVQTKRPPPISVRTMNSVSKRG
jgi:hypothetical protein